MIVRMKHRGREFEAEAEDGTDLAIGLDFGGEQPGFFDIGPARARALEVGGFIGDTRRGGSCNVARLELVPHCHGTHTESAAHLTGGAAAAPKPPPLMLAQLITVRPGPLGDSEESYPGADDPDEPVISSGDLAGLTADVPALIVRTRPNDEGKRTRQYRGDNPHPYFSLEAIDRVVENGTAHLLVDTPSIDRGRDDGSLPAHRRFWELDEQRGPTRAEALTRTITEFIYVPDALADGLYLLNLQVAAWQTDAVPSRPLLFSLREMDNA